MTSITKKPKESTGKSVPKVIESGTKVEITLLNQTVLTGTVIQFKNDVLNLKLSNGYNAGINREQILRIQTNGMGVKVGKAQTKPIAIDSSKPTIVVLHTGGTIASRVDYQTGGVSNTFKAEDLLSMYPELFLHFNVISEHLSNMWSEDMRFKQYERMAKAAEKYIKQGVKGVIIGHGTDTLAYTGAALSFMMQNVPVPVLLVGAQRSSDRPSSDARMNLACAAEFIRQSNFAGVALCMHENEQDDSCSILPGTKTRKNHTSTREAFEAVNSTPLARVHYPSGVIETFTAFKKPTGVFVTKTNMEQKVALVKVHPNFHAEQLKVFESFKGIIIEGTGLGQAPTEVTDDLNKENDLVRKQLEKIIQKGCIVVMTSQCINGRLNMNVYSKGIDLQKMGIIPGKDMLPETAFVKLAWVLANFSKKEVINKMQENLVGEITTRSMVN